MKFGIYLDDGYDYLQHLRAPGTALMEPAGLLGANDKRGDQQHVGNTKRNLYAPVL